MKKIIVLFSGISLMALGTASCNLTGLGIDPFNALSVALSTAFRIPLGTMVLILQALLGAIVLIFDRKKLGLGTLIPMFSFGYFLQFFNWLLPQFLNQSSILVLNLLIFIVGMLIITFGMSLYMSCGIGMVPYDCLAFIMSERAARKPFIFRIALDGLIAVIAFNLGGPINIGTILLALFIGPFVDLFRKILIKPTVTVTG